MLQQTMNETLEKLRCRIADPSRVTDGGRRTPYLPTTLERVQEVERSLGFELPPLLRCIYTKVGNGGFGPGYGLAGIDGCGTDEKRNDIVALYRGQHCEHWHRQWPRWPERMLRLAYLGCAMHACIDCAAVDFPVYLFEPNPSEQDLGFVNNLVPYDQTFNDWIRAWADGDDVALPGIMRDGA